MDTQMKQSSRILLTLVVVLSITTGLVLAYMNNEVNQTTQDQLETIDELNAKIQRQAEELRDSLAEIERNLGSPVEEPEEKKRITWTPSKTVTIYPREIVQRQSFGSNIIINRGYPFRTSPFSVRDSQPYTYQTGTGWNPKSKLTTFYLNQNDKKVFIDTEVSSYTYERLPFELHKIRENVGQVEYQTVVALCSSYMYSDEMISWEELDFLFVVLDKFKEDQEEIEEKQEADNNKKILKEFIKKEGLPDEA
jgi:hypothetical protein